MPEQYKTSDLGEAAALMAAGYRYVGLERANGLLSEKQRIFIFENDYPRDNTDLPKPELAAVMYRDEDLRVDALQYFQAIRDLKNAVYMDIRAAGAGRG